MASPLGPGHPMDSAMIYKTAGVVLYLGVLLVIGVVASRRMKDMRDYYAGGKQLGFWAAAFSARATGESAWLLLGLTGMGALVGFKGLWVVLGEVVGVGLAWMLMCGRFKLLTDRYDAITIPDYLEGRFRDTRQRLRRVSALALVIFVTIYVSAQIDATGTAFESFLGIDYFIGSLIGFAVVLVYIVSGGFVAVVWSDVFQGTLMLVGLVALPILGLVYAGGVEPVAESLRALDPSLLTLSGAGGWSLATVLQVVGLVVIGVGFLGSPQIFVRFLALKDTREVRPGAILAVCWTILGDTGAVLTGMVGRALLTETGGPSAEAVLGTGAQDVLPMLAEHILPAALVGLVIAIVLSAIMSTIDSLLVLASSAAVRDWYQQVRHPTLPDASLMTISRVVTVGLAVVALALSMTVAVLSPTRTVFWFVVFGWSGIAATFCPTMILSLFWSRMTTKGAMASMVTGFLCVPVFKFLVPEIPVIGATVAELSELPPSFALALLAAVVVSRMDKAGQGELEGVAEDLQWAARSMKEQARDGDFEPAPAIASSSPPEA